jgi:BASS family bile acid:Na+ symporter
VFDVLVPAITFLLMTVVGLGLSRDDFIRLKQQPLVVVGGLLGPLLLLPPLALALTWIFRAPPEVAAGVLLIASCPIGGISNTWSYLARAATALSVTLTGLSCLFAGVSMPLLARLFEVATGQRLELNAPMRLLVVQLLLMLALPVLLGMWLRARWPAFAARHRPALQRIAFAGVSVMLLIPLIDDPSAFVAGLSTTVPLAATFVTCSMGVGWAAAALLTRDRAIPIAERMIKEDGGAAHWARDFRDVALFSPFGCRKDRQAGASSNTKQKPRPRGFDGRRWSMDRRYLSDRAPGGARVAVVELAPADRRLSRAAQRQGWFSGVRCVRPC